MVSLRFLMQRFERKVCSLIRWLNIPMCYDMEYLITNRGSLCLIAIFFGCLKSDSRFDYRNDLL